MHNVHNAHNAHNAQCADFDIARTLPRMGEKLLEKRTHADGCTEVDAKRLFV